MPTTLPIAQAKTDYQSALTIISKKDFLNFPQAARLLFNVACYGYSNAQKWVYGEKEQRFEESDTLINDLLESTNPELEFGVALMQMMGLGLARDDAACLTRLQDLQKKYQHQERKPPCYASLCHALGWMYQEDRGIPSGKSSNKNKITISWYRQAAQAGNATSKGILGLMHYKKNLCVLEGKPTENNLQATRWLEEAARAGSITAMNYLGFIHYNGEDLPEGRSSKNDRQAIEWFQEAAKAKSATAMRFLGAIHRDGRIPENNSSKNKYLAMEWFRKAAELGDVTSMNFLGEMLRDNPGMSRDKSQESYRQAAKLFQKAAEAGHLPAMMNLGRMHESFQGMSILKSSHLLYALIWYSKAAKENYLTAIKACNRIFLSQNSVISLVKILQQAEDKTNLTTDIQSLTQLIQDIIEQKKVDNALIEYFASELTKSTLCLATPSMRNTLKNLLLPPHGEVYQTLTPEHQLNLLTHLILLRHKKKLFLKPSDPINLEEKHHSEPEIEIDDHTLLSALNEQHLRLYQIKDKLKRNQLASVLLSYSLQAIRENKKDRMRLLFPLIETLYRYHNELDKNNQFLLLNYVTSNIEERQNENSSTHLLEDIAFIKLIQDFHVKKLESTPTPLGLDSESSETKLTDIQAQYQETCNINFLTLQNQTKQAQEEAQQMRKYVREHLRSIKTFIEKSTFGVWRGIDIKVSGKTTKRVPTGVAIIYTSIKIILQQNNLDPLDMRVLENIQQTARNKITNRQNASCFSNLFKSNSATSVYYMASGIVSPIALSHSKLR